MRRVEQLEADQVVRDPGVEQCRPEGRRPDVQVEVVPGPGVYPDAAQPLQGRGVARRHPHRVPVQPALPHLRPQHPGDRIEWQLWRAVGTGGEARGDAEQPEQGHVLRLRERHPGPEVVPPPEDVPVVFPQVPDGDGELRDVGVLVECVARVGRERAEQVGPQHRRDHRAEPSARFPGNGPVRGVGDRPVERVHVGDDFVAQVRVIAPGARRVDELAAAVGGPGVRVHHDRGRRVAAREHRVGGLGERLPEGHPIPPHRHMPRVPLDYVHGGVRAVRLVAVAGWRVHEQWPLVRVSQRIVAQQSAADHVLVYPSG